MNLFEILNINILHLFIATFNGTGLGVGLGIVGGIVEPKVSKDKMLAISSSGWICDGQSSVDIVIGEWKGLLILQGVEA